MTTTTHSEVYSIIASFSRVEIDTKLPIVGEQKWKIWICSFNIPMAPGKTRSIVCSARNFFQFTMPGPAWWQVRTLFDELLIYVGSQIHIILERNPDVLLVCQLMVVLPLLPIRQFR